MKPVKHIYFEYISGRIREQCKGRKLLLLGTNTVFEEILLKSQGLKCSLYATMMPKKVGPDRVLLTTISRLPEEYYVVIPEVPKSKAITDALEQAGCREYDDYLFTARETVVIPPHIRDYQDFYGNRIHNGGFTVKLSPTSFNCELTVDGPCYVHQESVIQFSDNGGGRMHIGKKCHFMESKFSIYDNGVLNIGDHTTIGERSRLNVVHNCRIDLEPDCMLSFDVLIYCGDGHAIFDRTTGRKTNFFEEPDNPRAGIRLGKHTWVCAGSKILNPADIGRSCIIGAGSVFMGTLPENCIAAGCPAKKIRENIGWTRDMFETDIAKCDPEFDD